MQGRRVVFILEPLMVDNRKHTERVALNLTERELLDVSRLAALDDKSLGEYIRSVLRSAVYGQLSRLAVAGQVVDGQP